MMKHPTEVLRRYCKACTDLHWFHVKQCCVRTTLPFILDCLPFIGYTENCLDNAKTLVYYYYIATKQPGETE